MVQCYPTDWISVFYFYTTLSVNSLTSLVLYEDSDTVFVSVVGLPIMSFTIVIETLS